MKRDERIPETRTISISRDAYSTIAVEKVNRGKKRIADALDEILKEWKLGKGVLR
jgi:hypothetical protein